MITIQGGVKKSSLVHEIGVKNVLPAASFFKVPETDTGTTKAWEDVS
jgi:hypothetical protein